MPKQNEVVTLSLVVSGDTGSKFPRAILEDSGGVALAASPIDLTHVTNGRYTNVFTMPAKDVYINYIVYSDAGHTTKDPLFDQASETFELELFELADIKSSNFNMEISDDSELLMKVEGDTENININIEG